MGSFVVGGLGHGWVAPALVGWLAIPGCALVALAIGRNGSARARFAGVAVAVALIADLALLSATQREGFAYFDRMGALSIAWLVPWAAWQAAALALLVSSASSPGSK